MEVCLTNSADTETAFNQLNAHLSNKLLAK